MAYRSRRDLKLSHVLTDTEAKRLVMRRKQGATLEALAKEFGVHRNTVLNIIMRYNRQKDNE